MHVFTHIFSQRSKENRSGKGKDPPEGGSIKSAGPSELEWMIEVKDWAGMMISAQTLIGRILVRGIYLVYALVKIYVTFPVFDRLCLFSC